jgi:hypothetical protein
VVRHNERGYQIKPDRVAQTSHDAPPGSVAGGEHSGLSEHGRVFGIPATSPREPLDRFRRSARGNATAAVTRIAAPARRPGRAVHGPGGGVALPSLQDNFSTHHYLVTQPEPGDAV